MSGIKQLSLPSACPSLASLNPFASLHVYLHDDEISASASAITTFEASHTVFEENTPAANVVNQSGGVWALYDTGATHYMFKADSLFSTA